MSFSFNWYDDICEYFNVSPEEALELGTRKTGRKPSLPGHGDYPSVKDMTFEDIWNMKDRKTEKEIFDFYRDQGSWSAFRQCVRHSNMDRAHMSMIHPFLKDGIQICEYGSGVAPFSTTLLRYLSPNQNAKMSFTISDVDSVHFNFGKWRLEKLKNREGYENISVNSLKIEPNSLPKYNTKFDLVIIFEVLEHVPSPVMTISNLCNSMNPGGILLENFIKHDIDHHEDDGPDLRSAAVEREEYYDFLRSNFNMRSSFSRSRLSSFTFWYGHNFNRLIHLL